MPNHREITQFFYDYLHFLQNVLELHPDRASMLVGAMRICLCQVEALTGPIKPVCYKFPRHLAESKGRVQVSPPSPCRQNLRPAEKGTVVPKRKCHSKTKRKMSSPLPSPQGGGDSLGVRQIKREAGRLRNGGRPLPDSTGVVVRLPGKQQFSKSD